jgi:cellulose biosynthesis protein BcsQ
MIVRRSAGDGLSRFFDAVTRAEQSRLRSPLGPPEPEPAGWTARRLPRPFQVISVASNKGGVGKTTIATNLAVELRAALPEVEVLLLGLDDQANLDRMFALDEEPPGAAHRTVLEALREGDLRAAIRPGRHGVHYVPGSPDVAELKREIRDPLHLEAVLRRCDWRGLVVLDTKSDLEILTQCALAASDLVLVVVKDHPSLLEAEKVFRLLTRWGEPPERARIVLSLVDLRIKYREGEDRDVLSLLVSEIRRRGHPLCEAFLSASPKVEALATNPEGRLESIAHGAPGSIVHRQLRVLTDEVLGLLGRTRSDAEGRADPAPRQPLKRRLLQRAAAGTPSAPAA